MDAIIVKRKQRKVEPQEIKDGFKVGQVLNIDWDGPSRVVVTKIGPKIWVTRIDKNGNKLKGEENNISISPVDLVSMLDSEDKTISSKEDFSEYVKTVLKNAHGDKYDEGVANKIVEDLVAEVESGDLDWGGAIGKVTSSLGDSMVTEIPQELLFNQKLSQEEKNKVISKIATDTGFDIPAGIATYGELISTIETKSKGTDKIVNVDDYLVDYIDRLEDSEESEETLTVGDVLLHDGVECSLLGISDKKCVLRKDGEILVVDKAECSKKKEPVSDNSDIEVALKYAKKSRDVYEDLKRTYKDIKQTSTNTYTCNKKDTLEGFVEELVAAGVPKGEIQIS